MLRTIQQVYQSVGLGGGTALLFVISPLDEIVFMLLILPGIRYLLKKTHEHNNDNHD